MTPECIPDNFGNIVPDTCSLINLVSLVPDIYCRSLSYFLRYMMNVVDSHYFYTNRQLIKTSYRQHGFFLTCTLVILVPDISRGMLSYLHKHMIDVVFFLLYVPTDN